MVVPTHQREPGERDVARPLRARDRLLGKKLLRNQDGAIALRAVLKCAVVAQSGTGHGVWRNDHAGQRITTRTDNIAQSQATRSVARRWSAATGQANPIVMADGAVCLPSQHDRCRAARGPLLLWRAVRSTRDVLQAGSAKISASCEIPASTSALRPVFSVIRAVKPAIGDVRWPSSINPIEYSECATLRISSRLHQWPKARIFSANDLNHLSRHRSH